MVVQTKTKITADEFFQLPETNLPTELIDGEMIEMTAPELIHQDIVLNIAILFRQIAKRLGGKAYVAPVDVVFDVLNVPQPDVIYLVPESRCVPEGTKRLIGAPDLIAEVLSPGTEGKDRKKKFQLYERYGVREYWMVNPTEQFVEVYHLLDGKFDRLDVYGVDEKFSSPLLGEIVVSDIFPT